NQARDVQCRTTRRACSAQSKDNTWFAGLRSPGSGLAMRISIYDTTLRDGSQGEGVNFSLQDKLLLTAKLDELGVHYVEGGYPLSNPKDFEYFQAMRGRPLAHAKVVAFGMTRRKNADAATDTCLKALLDAQTPVVTIVGKTWDMHVRDILGTDLEENLRMIADSVATCKAAG